MKRFFLVTILLVAALATHINTTRADTDDAQTLNSEITEVTIYADRARVTRTSPIRLGTTLERYAFRKLPGWIDESSVRATLEPPETGEIADVEIRKNYLVRSDEEQVLKAEASVREIEDQLAALEDERRVLDAEAQHIESIKAFSLEKLPRDMAVRDIPVQEYAQVVDFVSASLRRIADARREITKKQRDLSPELDTRRKQLAELRQSAQLEERVVVVSLKGNATRQATLELTYLLPGATWEPAHELRATQDGSSVELASFALVTQTTGEDWKGASISLSTQRPTATMRLPELETLLVGGKTMARVVGSANDSFVAAQQAYEGQNRLWNAMKQGKSFEQEYEANESSQRLVQERVAQVFANLEERGTSAHFKALAPRTIRSDGRLVRVPIGNTRLAAKHSVLAVPETSLNAAHTVELVNDGEQPLLPGRVWLYLGGAFLGHTEMAFVAPGESFTLYLGVADQIKLSRAIDFKHSGLQRTGRRIRIDAAFIVGLENLSEREARVQWIDRVPVSELSDVKVRNVSITPEVVPDEKGLIRKEVVLAAKQKATFRIEYSVEYPADFLERPRDLDTKELAPGSPDEDDTLYEQLERLERALE